jgi:aldehyde dehydrogenase (NAD+)
MGGLNASIICPDADVEATAVSIANAAMSFAGQKCTATSRIILAGECSGMVDSLVAAVEALALGTPTDHAVVVGPVINEDARNRVVSASRAAQSEGARILTSRGATGPGWMVAPILLEGAPTGSAVVTEEIFGPLAVIIQAADLDEAIAINNSTTYGIATSVYTSDLRSALQSCESVDTGMIKINQPTTGIDFHGPFGGAKASGSGPKEQGKAAADFYTWTQTIAVAAQS